jgi:DNA segregation ATPase FtsK/SpoIIIE, S-DNA-T family
MTDTEILGEVIDLDARRDTPTTPPPRGPGRTGAPPAPDDPGDDSEPAAHVLADAPPEAEPGKLTAAWASRGGHRHPVIPAWIRNLAEVRARVRWLATHLAHTAAYHAVRAPKYGARLAVRSPRGAARTVTGVHRWVFDHEALPLRLDAVQRNDPETYVKLLRHRDDRVRWRAILVTAGAVAGVLAALVITAKADALGKLAAFFLLVGFLGWLGSPADQPLLDTAVVVPRVQRLTSAILIRAFAALGIAEINKAVSRGGDGITFPAPITRDGPGWRADIDLPYGVTAVDILDRRDRLASGLRRPLGCVWPEPAHDQHAGRVMVWVGDQDMNQVKPAPWPLAKAGTCDLFKAVPFGTDPRGRAVTLTLMYANALIAAMPGMGKTFALRILALSAALDVTARLLVFELKGTGDLEATAKVAHAYASGADDDTIAAALQALRSLHKELETRAKAIKGLPKDACPENKVTPPLAARRSLGLYPLVMIIDECQELFAHPTMGKEAGELATAIIKRGRALGVILLLATQRPDKDSLPTGISANVGIRLCLRVMGQIENDMILGTSAYKNGIRATTFTRRDLGIGYLIGDEADPQIVRSYYVDGPAAETICDRARAARIAAGTLSGQAAGEIDAAAPAASILDDILAVTNPGEDKARSQVVVDRLAQLRPDIYGPWAGLEPAAKATQLATALSPYGIETVQVNRREAGKPVNTRGVVRADVMTVRDRLRGKHGDGDGA